MFNNIIYFLVIILIYNFSFPGNVREDPFFINLLMIVFTWAIYAYYCRFCFERLIRQLQNFQFQKEIPGAPYHNLVFRLSILAILLFVLDVYVFHLKYWLHFIPFVSHLTILENLIAIALFVFYLSTIWFFAHPAYLIFFSSNISKDSFVKSNVRLNFPILFPYLALTLINDLVIIGPWEGLKKWLDGYSGQFIFFTLFILILMVFMPLLIKYFWGCTPLKSSEKIQELQSFLKEKGFRYSELLSWPIFEGRMITAGIMGIVPRYRYILVTDSLLERLSIEELKAVLAHEMGHAKYRHLLFYVIFFIGYMFISFGVIDIFYVYLATQPGLTDLFNQNEGLPSDLLYLIMAMPILVMVLIYFRYIMGFFMRHFERQADLYSAVVMNSPIPTISSLEKIAFLGGKIRELPSWHHFSIKQRVDYLWRTLKEKDLARRHNRFLIRSFGIYLVAVFGLGVVLNLTPLKEHLKFGLIEEAIQKRIRNDPKNIDLLIQLAMIYHELDRIAEAKVTYEEVLELDPERAVALNNLAWLLVTDPDEESRDPKRAIVLAEKAVAIEKSAGFMDTLAEAYYIDGNREKAIEIIQEAIGLAKENKDYFLKQLKRFRSLN